MLNSLGLKPQAIEEKTLNLKLKTLNQNEISVPNLATIIFRNRCFLPIKKEAG
jgi:hypothetical protein